MSECQKWPHIQSLSQRRASLSLIAGKKAVMPWPGLPILGGSRQLDIWVTDIRPVIARECHQCPDQLGSHHHPRVRIKRVGHTAPHCSPPTIVPALVHRARDCCSRYCLSCNNISLYCLLPHQAERKLIFLCISQPSVTLLSQTSRSTSLCICSFDCAVGSGRRPFIIWSCHKVYRFLFSSNLQDHYCLLRRAQNKTN